MLVPSPNPTYEFADDTVEDDTVEVPVFRVRDKVLHGFWRDVGQQLETLPSAWTGCGAPTLTMSPILVCMVQPVANAAFGAAWATTIA